LSFLKSRITDPDKIAILESQEGGDALANTIGSPRATDAINTKNLDLSGRGLTELPESFVGPLLGRDIQSVDLHKNKLEDFPDRVLELCSSIHHLILSSNLIPSIPSTIGHLKYLTTLLLSGNRLTHLPNELAQCTMLRELDISYNRFSTFPSAIYDMKKIEILQVSNNKIECWDMTALEELEDLHTLDLTNNELQSVPPELGRMNLRSLHLEGNPSKVPRPALLAKGTPEILKYLRSRLPESVPH
jgi:Leucine-rich repeat (LRR) protein